MDNRPIGVFDSGLGGLTVVRELELILPYEDILYFGDTGRVPYGTRGTETIQKYTAQDIAFLKNKGVKMIIAACGTVSSTAANVLDELDIPWTGVVIPASIAAVKATDNERIGVLGTAATVNSGAFEREILKYDPGAEIFSQACPLFVPLVENGMFGVDEIITRLTVERYLVSMMKNDVDTLILGCTHFPLLAPIIQKVMGRDVVLIDAGREAAQFASDILRRNRLMSRDREDVQRNFFVSDKTADFSRLAGIFLGCDVSGNIGFVDVDNT